MLWEINGSNYHLLRPLHIPAVVLDIESEKLYLFCLVLNFVIVDEFLKVWLSGLRTWNYTPTGNNIQQTCK